MWKNKEQPVVKTGKMCRIAQNYEHGRALPLHAVRWLGIMIDSQNIPLRRMSTNEIRYRWIIGLFISQYTFIKLNISHIYELFRHITPCIYIYFHDKLVRNWCGVWESTFGKRVHHDRLFVKNESCKEINAVNHLLSCEFNIDTACVELKYADGSMISIDTIAVENEVADNMYERSELDWLIYNAPAEYADLVLNGDPVKYLKTVTVYKPFEN